MERVAGCQACQQAGYLVKARPITAEAREARVMVIGQAPGPVTHREGVHFVGAMAIRAFLGPIKLDDTVGQQFEWQGRAVIPFPHSSGVSRWANAPANRAKIDQAVERLREAREAIPA